MKSLCCVTNIFIFSILAENDDNNNGDDGHENENEHLNEKAPGLEIQTTKTSDEFNHYKRTELGNMSYS